MGSLAAIAMRPLGVGGGESSQAMLRGKAPGRMGNQPMHAADASSIDVILAGLAGLAALRANDAEQEMPLIASEQARLLLNSAIPD